MLRAGEPAHDDERMYFLRSGRGDLRGLGQAFRGGGHGLRGLAGLDRHGLLCIQGVPQPGMPWRASLVYCDLNFALSCSRKEETAAPCSRMLSMTVLTLLYSVT